MEIFLYKKERKLVIRSDSSYFSKGKLNVKFMLKDFVNNIILK